MFEHNRCVSPAALRVTAGGVALQAPWVGGQVCGEVGAPAGLQQPVLRPRREMSAP